MLFLLYSVSDIMNNTTLASNETLDLVTKYFNINISTLTNQSAETQVKLFDLYEMYRTKEKEQLMVYKLVAYVIGTLIILSNLTVVISSGLILKKGQQPKSTYLLLGNVSLADTIVGISIIFGTIVDNNMSSNPLCIFQIGTLVCPAMVSIFSVGLIAVDRYIYILHGLYYQRWFTTTKVRIGILCIWMIGLILGFLPATGWVNKELHFSRCYYVGLFPAPLILINASLSIIPVIVVAVLYSIILVKALANVKKIKAVEKSVKRSDPEPKLRICRGNGNVKKVDGSYSVKYPNKTKENKIRRSVSFNHYEIQIVDKRTRSLKSKSINDLDSVFQNETIENDEVTCTSEFSVHTIESESDPNNMSSSEVSVRPNLQPTNDSIRIRKPREPNRWRAITVVMLTSGSFIFTWVPFFIVVIFFVFCEEKLTNVRCVHYKALLGGPLATLAFINSFLNPLIYAWWHKGFQRTVKMYFRRYLHKYFSIFISSLPAMGWTGNTFRDFRCWYIALFPPVLLIIVSVIVLSVIIMVCILYILILHSAVKTVDRIREYRETNSVAYINTAFDEESKEGDNTTNNISKTKITITIDTTREGEGSSIAMRELSKTDIEERQFGRKFKRKVSKISTYYGQAKALNSHPSKLKAVKTVLILILCFMGTWAPYYVAIIMYVRCDIMVHGYECLPLEVLTLGPLFILGVCNSLCDPLIYAWRHSGFKKTMWKIYWKYIRQLRMRQ